MPLVGRADAGVLGAPSEVVEQPVTTAIPLPTAGRTRLPTELMEPIVAGAARLVVTPPTQVEVAAAVTDGSQPGTTVAVPEALA